MLSGAPDSVRPTEDGARSLPLYLREPRTVTIGPGCHADGRQSRLACRASWPGGPPHALILWGALWYENDALGGTLRHVRGEDRVWCSTPATPFQDFLRKVQAAGNVIFSLAA